MDERGALEELLLAEELLTVDGSWWRENYFFSRGMWLLMGASAPVDGPIPMPIWAPLMGLSGLFK